MTDDDEPVVLILDEDAKARLRQFVEDVGPKIEARDDALRSEGALAKAAGVPITGCPHFVGSYVSVRWFEGWSGTRAPRREFISGRGFNMTPQQDIEQFTDWIMSLGLPDEFASRALHAHRSGYRAEFHPKPN